MTRQRARVLCSRRLPLPLLLLVVALLEHAVAADSHNDTWRYAVVIDAGSTGSRAHVFRFRHDAARPASLPLVQLPERVAKVAPGLPAYARHPQQAGASLQPLIKFARQQVPEALWHETPIQLFATAGLRLLHNATGVAILREVHDALAASGFAAAAAAGTSPARVLSGSGEGLLGFLAVNYATGALQAAAARDERQAALGRKGGTTPPALVGVLELGGGSLQVTFSTAKPAAAGAGAAPPERPPPGQAVPLALLPALGVPVAWLYTQSFDGLGLQAAHAQHVHRLQQAHARADPCLPRGYTPLAAHSASSASAASSRGLAGGSDWAACKASVARLVPRGGPCRYRRCGLQGTFLPDTQGVTFRGLDNFFYTASALRLPTAKPLSLAQLDAAAAGVCGMSWQQQHAAAQQGGTNGVVQASFLPKVCFGAALILGLLRDGLQLAPSMPLLTASNTITTQQGTQLEARWPLGALLLNLAQQQQQQQQQQANRHAATTAATEAPGTSESGLSATTAAAVALLFCTMLLMMSGFASWMGVGLPGNGRCGWLWRQLTVAWRRSSSTTVGAGARYARVRPTSRGGPDAPRSPSPAAAIPHSSAAANGRDVEVGQGGVTISSSSTRAAGAGGSIVMSVLLPAAPAAAASLGGSSDTSQPHSSSSRGVALNRPSSARQR